MSRLAILTPGEDFTQAWINTCIELSLDYEIIDVNDNDFFEKVKVKDCVFWHYSHNNRFQMEFASSILSILETLNIRVFPKFEDRFHFDNKVIQKYLFDAHQIHTPKTMVLYNSISTLQNEIEFPVVVKLKGGAGSENTWIVSSRNQLKNVVRKMFGKGIRRYSIKRRMKLDIVRSNGYVEKLRNMFKAVFRVFLLDSSSTYTGRERGYVYLQEFISDLDCDIRIIIVGERAFGLKRFVRDGDFRASGSGMFEADVSKLPIECVKLAFDFVRKNNGYCCAFDFIISDNEYMLLEVSYGFKLQAYLSCTGYYSGDLIYHEETFNPCFWMINDYCLDE